MTQIAIQRRRTGWDIVFGILLFIGGLLVLGDAVIATTVSVLFVGWLVLISGIIGIIASLFKIGQGGGFWSTLLGGALMAVLGLMMLRNTGLTAGFITILAGLVFLVAGVVRLAAGLEQSSARWVLVISGIAGIVLGLIVLFNVGAASLTLIGILIGVQLLIDGLTLMTFGRVHVDTTTPGA